MAGGRTARIALTLALIPALAGVALLATPYPSGLVQRYLDHLVAKGRQGRLDPLDLVVLEAGFRAGAAAGGFVYPEAGAMLQHFFFGGGEELRLPADYVRRSEVVRSAIEAERFRVPIHFDAERDPRLYYALNGFFLSRRDLGDAWRYRLARRIEFDDFEDRASRTEIRLGAFRVILNDGLLLALEQAGFGAPYRIYAEWDEPKAG